MKNRLLVPIFTCLALLFAAMSVRAQLVNDGVSIVTNTITGDVTVGTNGSFTLLRQPFC